MSASRQAQARLAALLREHGLAVVEDGGWLLVGTGKLPMRASTCKEREDERGGLAQLDVQLALPDGRLLTESYSSTGSGLSAALDQSLQKFAGAALHPILTAFFGAEPEEATRVLELQVGGRTFEVTLGAALLSTRGQPDDPCIPADLDDWVKSFLSSRTLSDAPVHWFRLFRAENLQGPPTVEVLIDGEISEEGQAQAARLGWSARGDYWSLRTVGILIDRSAPGPVGQDFRSLEGATVVLGFVASALPPESSDAELVDALVSGAPADPAPIAESAARRVVAQAPLAFTAALLHRLGREPSVALPWDEPAFVAAYEVGQRRCASTLATEEFEAVARRSPLFAEVAEASRRHFAALEAQEKGRAEEARATVERAQALTRRLDALGAVAARARAETRDALDRARPAASRHVVCDCGGAGDATSAGLLDVVTCLACAGPVPVTERRLRDGPAPASALRPSGARPSVPVGIWLPCGLVLVGLVGCAVGLFLQSPVVLIGSFLLLLAGGGLFQLLERRRSR